MRHTSLVIIFLISVVSQSKAANFEPACTVYFDDIKGKQKIDGYFGCAAEGKTSDTKKQLQNRTKNYFCAHLDDQGKALQPINFTEADFIDLMKKVDTAGVTYGGKDRDDGKDHMPKDRSVLQQIGEGKFIRFVGYIANARYAPKSSGESVNCNKNKWQSKDIHLELSIHEPGYLTADGCKAWITAEISPHLRPYKWNVDNLNQVRANTNPIRVSGQLFFDASHIACPETTYRLSSWEIHPVYSVDVCKEFTLSDCKIDDDEAWIPLHTWTELPWEEYVDETD